MTKTVKCNKCDFDYPDGRNAQTVLKHIMDKHMGVDGS